MQLKGEAKFNTIAKNQAAFLWILPISAASKIWSSTKNPPRRTSYVIRPHRF